MTRSASAYAAGKALAKPSTSQFDTMAESAADSPSDVKLAIVSGGLMAIVDGITDSLFGGQIVTDSLFGNQPVKEPAR